MHNYNIQTGTVHVKKEILKILTKLLSGSGQSRLNNPVSVTRASNMHNRDWIIQSMDRAAAAELIGNYTKFPQVMELHGIFIVIEQSFF